MSRNCLATANTVANPEQAKFLGWRPNFAWALLIAQALVISLFGMWQRVEFLYFQF
jgi:hypothetical protein